MIQSTMIQRVEVKNENYDQYVYLGHKAILGNNLQQDVSPRGLLKFIHTHFPDWPIDFFIFCVVNTNVHVKEKIF